MTINPKQLIPRRDFLTTATFGIVAGFGFNGLSRSAEKQAAEAIEALLDLVRWDIVEEFNVDRYLHAAVQLQALGKDVACDVLYSFAKKLHTDNKSYSPYREASLIALARMLFIKRSDSEFRQARIGAPGFFSDTGDEDWPIAPIEIIDGVPFSIVSGYMLAGYAEPLHRYIGYCLETCDWNIYRFEMKSDAQKQEALSQLLASPKFKTPLTVWERALLLEQIR